MAGPDSISRKHRSYPVTLSLGLGVILICQALLFVDVALRGWAVMPDQVLAPPKGALQTLGRWIAVDMTPICWIGFLLACDGALTLQSWRRGDVGMVFGSPVRTRPRRFIFCFLVSVPLWLIFDWVNFAVLGAWQYHGLPENWFHRYLGYFFAFGAIGPAMFLSAEFYQQCGLRRILGKRLSFGAPMRFLFVAIGLIFMAFPFAVRDPVGSLTLWLGCLFFLDPINDHFGAPSILGDWRSGRWGRTLALMAGGATCGLLWEFWNYWAASKWTYDLPFLGPFEAARYFEMPLAGLLGFPAFAVEFWVMFQTILMLCERLGLDFRDPAPDETGLL